MKSLTILFTILVIVILLYFGISISKNSFLENLKWRRAVKTFSPGYVDTEPITQAIINAPSSFGLQPYTVIIVENQEIKKKLREVCFNQSQIEECSSLYIFCVLKNFDERISVFFERTKAEHLKPIMNNFLEKCPDLLNWCKNQVYIALGFGLAAAAEKKIASCPMEGFNAEKMSELLLLNENLLPCVLLAVGKEGDNSKLPPRFRFNRDELISEVK